MYSERGSIRCMLHTFNNASRYFAYRNKFCRRPSHKRYEKPRPVYFKQISTANTICNIYSVDLNLDIQNYFANNAVILNGITNLENACKTIEKEEICRNIIAPLRAQLHLIYEQALTIESFHSKFSKRDANNIVQTNSSADMISNILAITSDSITRTNEEIDRIANEIKNLQNIQYDIKLTDLHNRLNLMTQSILINIDRQIKLSTIIFDVITDINVSKIFELFSPSTFLAIIKRVQISANNERCEIPIHPFKHHLSSVLKTAKITAKLVWDTINIKIDFPTAKKEEFSLHELIPLPFTSSDKTYVIKPFFSYMLSRVKSNYEYEIQYMSVEDKNNCIDMPNNVYFCRPTQPIYTVKEIFLNNDNNFVKRDILPCNFRSIHIANSTECNFEKTVHQNIAINIDYDKYYIHVITPFIAELICSNNKTDIMFSYTQICHTPSDCDLRSDSVKIYTHRTKNVDVSKIEIEKNIMLNRIDIDLDLLNDTFQLPPKVKTGTSHKQQEDTNNFKDKVSNLFNLEQKKYTDKNITLQATIHAILIFTPFAICLILCYYIYKLKKSIQEVKDNPIYNHIVRTIEPDENSGYEKPFNLVFHYDVPKNIITPASTFETFYEERKKRLSGICLEPAPLLPERKYKKLSPALIEMPKVENNKNTSVIESPKKDSREKNIKIQSNQTEKEESPYVCMTYNSNKKHVTWASEEPISSEE